MLQRKPLILLTNDDGYDSPGIIEMASVLVDDFDVYLVAPRDHYSGAGRSIPYGASYRGEGSITTHRFELGGDKSVIAYAVHGSPAITVTHAMLEIVPRKPDLCISGINFGANVGLGLHYSGTIGAAMEAASFGVPSFAVSLELDDESVFSHEGTRELFTDAAHITRTLASAYLEKPLEMPFVCLNINVPLGATGETPIVRTGQSRYNRWDWTRPEREDLTQPFQFTSGEATDAPVEEGSDIHAVFVEKKIAVTPLTFLMQAPDDQVDDDGLSGLFSSLPGEL